MERLNEIENKVARHDEKIITLFKHDEATNKRIDDMESMKNLIYSLDKNMALQTQLLESVVEHNKKQDARADKQDQMMIDQQQINMKINENLTELAEGQRTLNKRVGKLEERVEDNENKQKLDIRDIQKEEHKKKLTGKEVAISAAVAVALISAIGNIVVKLIEILGG